MNKPTPSKFVSTADMLNEKIQEHIEYIAEVEEALDFEITQTPNDETKINYLRQLKTKSTERIVELSNIISSLPSWTYEKGKYVEESDSDSDDEESDTDETDETDETYETELTR